MLTSPKTEPEEVDFVDEEKEIGVRRKE